MSVVPKRKLARIAAPEARRMLTFARELAGAPDEDEISTLLVREAQDLFPSELAVVFLRDPDGSLRSSALTGRTDLVPLACAAADRSPALLVQRPSDAHTVGPSFETGASTEDVRLVTAQLASERALGVLVLALPGEALEMLDHDLLGAFTDLASSSLENVRLRQGAIQQARLDYMTGLGNRRAFHEHLSSLVTLPLPSTATEVTLVLFDIDDFKSVNDRSGHRAGDEVLRILGRAVLGASRSSEEVFRLGGDEFALVIRGGRDAGVRAADRVRRAVLAQRRSLPLPTLSGGVASLPRDAETVDELLERADAALYAAKRAGKGQVISWQCPESAAPAEA